MSTKARSPRKPATRPRVAAPTPRPAKGFGTARAQKWVLAAAILTAIIYGFRRALEPSVQQAPARGGTASKLAGAGSPPPSLGHWAVAYGAGFILLSFVSLGAPEVAASIAMLMVAGTMITNGTAIVTDIQTLEGGKTTTTIKPLLPPNPPPGTAGPAGATGNAPAPAASGPPPGPAGPQGATG
jgi:hypothetical protein